MTSNANWRKVRYNSYMFNWSTDTTKLKEVPAQYQVWKLEQLINFGLGNEKLPQNDLLACFNKLHIDPQKKKYLQFLLSKCRRS